MNVGSEPDFLNIVNNLEIPLSNNKCKNIYDVQDSFCSLNDMQTIPEVTKLIKEIDINKSS